MRPRRVRSSDYLSIGDMFPSSASFSIAALMIAVSTTLLTALLPSTALTSAAAVAVSQPVTPSGRRSPADFDASVDEDDEDVYDDDEYDDDSDDGDDVVDSDDRQGGGGYPRRPASGSRTMTGGAGRPVLVRRGGWHVERRVVRPPGVPPVPSWSGAGDLQQTSQHQQQGYDSVTAQAGTSRVSRQQQIERQR